MRTLVTGGAGFIGSHFIEHLLEHGSGEIICLDNFNDFYDPAIKRRNVAAFADRPNVKLVEASFCDAAAMRQLFAEQRPTHVVHLGGYAGVRSSVRDPLIYEQHNVHGTLVLLEAVRQFPVERFVLVSSSTVYGRGASVPFVEDAPLGIPMSPYGSTKRAAELLGLTYFALHQVPVVCVRPFSVYGPRQRPDLALNIFARAIAERKPLKLFGDGSYRRDFTHVQDICAGLLAAMTSDGVTGECINLGHNEPVEIRALIRLLETELGRTANIEYHAAAESDLPVTCADLTKAERLLGYRPTLPLAQGVAEFIAWFRPA